MHLLLPYRVRALSLEVVITDSRDRRINRVDTVAITWALSAPGLASLAVQGKVMVTAEDRDGSRQPGTSTQVGRLHIICS